MWWFAATVLAAPDLRAAIGRSASTVTDDPTPDILAASIPEGATVCVIGWPDLVGDALVRRGDVTVLVVDAGATGRGTRSGASGRDLVHRLVRSEVEAEVVDPGGLGAAALAADLVLVEALAASPGELLVSAGSRAAASVAYCGEVPVWAVVGAGRVLPDALFAAAVGLAGDGRRTWDAEAETMPIGLAGELVDPTGLAAMAPALVPACAPVPELSRLRR